MSIIKGVMSYTRFLVESDQELCPKDMCEKLNLFRFRPLHEKGEDSETVGWCPYLSEYDHEKAIEISDFLYDDDIILSLRMDSILLPRELLKTLVKKSMKSYQQEFGKWPDRVVKKELETAEAKSLRARIFPKIKIIEAVWSQHSKELKIFSRSPHGLDKFLALFEQTFLLRPMKKDFAHQSVACAHKKDLLLENIVHEPMFSAPIRIDVQ